MKLLTLFGVVLLITSGTWAYTHDCAKGSEYWCRDVATAKACGAVHHCEKTVWRAKQNDEPSMTISETAEMLCNVLVQASTKLLADGSVNVNSIKPYLRSDCTKLPDQNNLIQQCEIAVDLYLSDILRHIESGTESTKICPIIQRHDTSSVVIPKPKSNELTSNATCVLCEFILHVVESLATANASEKELVLIFEKVCTELPAVLRDECKSFVDSYGADIIALLVREVDPAKICELIKLCPKPKDVAFLTKPNGQTCGLCDYVSTYLTNGHPTENVCSHFSTDNGIRQQCEILAHLHKPNMCSQLPLCFEEAAVQPAKQPIDTKVNSVECPLCKFIVQYVDNAVKNNKSEAAIEAALEKVCTILPHALNSSCVQFVDNFGPILVQLIEKYGTPDLVCDAIKFCHNGTQELAPPKPVQSIQSTEVPINSIECTLCEFVVNYVNKALGANRSAAAVEALLEKACNILPSSLRPNCTSFVTKYGAIIAFLLAKNETPAQVCDFIKVCHNGTQEAVPRDTHATFKVEQPTVNSVECSLCKFIVQYVDNAVKNNKSEAAIEAALEKVCTILPHALNSSCVQFVDTFGPNLVQLIEKYGTPDLVCAALKLCHNGTEEITPAEPLVATVECSLCKYIVGYVDNVVQNNKSEAAIEAALEKVCTILPHALNSSCVQFVETFGPNLVQLIEKYGTPELVCAALKLCHNGTNVAETKSDKIVEPKQNVNEDLECTLCKYVISFVNVLIESNATEQEIEKGLKDVCRLLPTSYQTKCANFVSTYGPIIPELVVELDDPNVVCELLKMCKKSYDKFVRIPPLKKNVKSMPCNLCEYLVNYLDAIIESNSTETKFEDALDNACKILPETKLQSECKILANLYGADLIKFLMEFGDPKTVCKELGICPK